MSKIKKKKSPISQKHIDAQRKNYFLSHLKNLFNKITNNDQVFNLLPKSELDQLYAKRFRPIKVKAGLNQKIPKDILQYCQQQIKQALNDDSFPLNIGKLEKITYYDYLSIGYTILRYHALLNEKDFKDAIRVKQSLSKFAQKFNLEINSMAIEKYCLVTEQLSMLLSDLDSGLCIINNVKIEESNYVGYIMEIYEVKTIKKDISIDGEKRITHKLGWAIWQETFQIHSFQIQYLTIASEKLGLTNNIELDVYIQNHTLKKLNERMDDMNPGYLHFNTFESLRNPKVCRNNNGNLLIEFRMFGVKTGYFLAEIIDEILVLKTFLFLINNGTPEGDKLNRNTGLMKEDKKYLNIDKISAFLNSDIPSNDRLKKIFIDAGCESLFNVDKSLYLGEVEKQKKLGDVFTRYLKLDNNKPANETSSN